MINKTPLTIFTGHLGSGKTTLIQKVLEIFETKKILVIENEFGEIGIDGKILDENKNALVELNAGCICCNIQSDLELILERYIADGIKFDHIIIEATGVANPAKIATTFIAPSYLSRFYELNSIITVVDSIHVDKHRELDEFELQLLSADTYYLSKQASSDSLGVEEICNKLKISMESVVDDLSIESWFETKSFFRLDDDTSLKGGHSHYQKISFEIEGEFDPFTLENYLNVLFMQYMGRIFRSKGVLFFRKNNNPYIFQGVFDSLSFVESENFNAEKNINKLIFIGKDLDEKTIESSLRNCLADE